MQWSDVLQSPATVPNPYCPILGPAHYLTSY